ncbi:restriction endonuclease [Clostridium botulinum]|nr:restriction endonuclease [Clostridium botulinum]
MKGHFFRKQELERLLEDALNKTLGQVDKNNVFDRTKTNPKITGIAGDVIEQSVLGFPADNKQRPDLDVEGIDIELKTTGIRLSQKNSKQYEAKEPMSITAVSPKKIVKEDFYDSNYWHKLENMLLVYYHYDSFKTVKASEYANFYIRGYEFHKFSQEDENRLRADWEIVRDFIRQLQNQYDEPENEYPRISSELRSRLVYIDTAPKWPNRPRFRLKRQFLTSIVQNHFGNRLEQLPGKYMSFNDIDRKCSELTSLYCGKTVQELVDILGIEGKINKVISEQIVVRMFGGEAKKISKIELFRKFGLVAKTITLTKTGCRTEDMKLFTIDFDEWLDVDTKFEDSKIYDYFANRQLLCILFEEPSMEALLKENVFIGFKRLSFSDRFIQNDVKKVWEDIRDLVYNDELKESIIYDKHNKPRVNKKNGTIQTSINFPKSKDSIIFVRGTGQDSKDKPVVLNDISMYRQNIWLKGSYVARELNELEIL